MSRSRRLILVSGLVALGLLTIGASAEARPSAGSAVASSPHTGGSVSFLSAGDVDSLDPGETHSPFGYMIAYATGRPLYSYEPSNRTSPVADLASGPPKVNPSRTKVTV